MQFVDFLNNTKNFFGRRLRAQGGSGQTRPNGQNPQCGYSFSTHYFSPPFKPVVHRSSKTGFVSSCQPRARSRPSGMRMAAQRCAQVGQGDLQPAQDSDNLPAVSGLTAIIVDGNRRAAGISAQDIRKVNSICSRRITNRMQAISEWPTSGTSRKGCDNKTSSLASRLLSIVMGIATAPRRGYVAGPHVQLYVQSMSSLQEQRMVK